MEKCKYLYLCISPYDKGVYQTQVVDWLNLYRDNALEFELTQLWTTNPFSRTRKKYQISQNEMIKAAYKGPFQSWNLFPRTFGLSFFDRFIFRRKIAKYLDKYEKVVLFCRYDAAPVFGYVNKVFPGRVFYYSDLRGAGAEEYMDRIKSTKDYTDAALIYYQQGLGDAESQRRAEITMKTANVTGQNGREASEQLTVLVE